MRSAMHKMYNMEAAEKAAKHAKSLLKDIPTQACIGLYSSVGDELNPCFLAHDLEQKGYRLALPVVTGKNTPLEFKRWGQGDPLSAGPYGIEEPETNAPIVIPDVLIVPLLAYDENCYRLGWGGGYYDRTIAKYSAIKAFGFAYAAQIVDDLPTEPHDLPLHGVITETGVILPKK
ncbi:5-formyltetrahydrofolate cyclo-ligase [Kordiimonas sp. SCSIO 12610]|nr:5-formyltetrahydrofolate cyclo-ligase [Kordiimonas sp. SCSIO 12610]